MQRRKPRQQHAFEREVLGAERGGESEGRRQRYRHRRQHRGEDEHDDLRRGQRDDVGIGNQPDHDRRVENRQVANEPEHRFDLGAFDMGDAHEFGGATEKGCRSGCGDHGNGFTAAHQRAGIGELADACFNRDRLAGQHRLIEDHRAFENAHIGGNDGGQRQLHDIVGDQECGRQLGPAPIAPGSGCEREPLFEQLQRGVGPAFLKGPECHVENQQRGDQSGFDALPHHELEDHRCFEHPRHRRPKMPQDPYEDMLVFFGDFVAAMLRQQPRRFVGRQSGRRLLLGNIGVCRVHRAARSQTGNNACRIDANRRGPVAS